MTVRESDEVRQMCDDYDEMTIEQKSEIHRHVSSNFVLPIHSEYTRYDKGGEEKEAAIRDYRRRVGGTVEAAIKMFQQH